MTPSSSRLGRSLVLLLLPLSACSTYHGAGERQQGRGPAAAKPPALAEPISRNHFRLRTARQSVVGEPQIVFIEYGQTLADLGREYGLGYDEILTANPEVDPWLPATGTPVLLPTQFVLPAAPRRGVVLNLASKRLFYYPDAEPGTPQPVLTYPIGIGRVGWETPLGSTRVVAKARDPHWYVPASVREEHRAAGDPLPAVVPPGPDNPLGRFALQLELPGYLIHGTNRPYGVGMRVSHGCVRLYPENIEQLYELVDVGVPVTIVNQPYLVGWRGEELFFEAHPPLEDDAVDTAQHLDALIAGAADSGMLRFGSDAVRAQLRTVAADARGVPILVQKGDLDEIYERAHAVRNTVEPDPNAPTLSEVRAILEAPLDVTAAPEETATQ